MKKSIYIFSLIISAFVLLSFSAKNTPSFIGTYGSAPSQIKLTLHDNFTFEYRDFSVSDQKIDIHGQWTQKGNKVVLKAQNPDVQFHDRWSFDKKGQIAHARKGLSFYRLCKVNE